MLAYISSRGLVGLVTLTALMLGACSSKVPLSEPAPVVDVRAPQRARLPQPPTAPVDTPQVTPREIRPVVVQANDQIAAGVIYFEFDSYIVKPEYQRLIDATARTLNANRSGKVSLAGHTDDLGGREYNLSLGQRRAEAVRQALNLLGVQEVQMEAVSYGKEKPASDATDEAARAKNRRVEISTK